MKRKKFTNFIEDTKLYLKNKVSRKIDAFAKYTVVSACYNVSLYLDDFFRSMVLQISSKNGQASILTTSPTSIRKMAVKQLQEI